MPRSIADRLATKIAELQMIARGALDANRTEVTITAYELSEIIGLLHGATNRITTLERRAMRNDPAPEGAGGAA